MADVTFLRQREPIDEYGRALYAVGRSVVRALLDQLGPDELTDFNCDRQDVTLRQMARVVRLDLDKGMKGDGFEWAVHEAIIGAEPMVLEPLTATLSRVSRRLRSGEPTSLLFGYERAKYLGFLDAVVDTAGEEAVLLPDGSGRPFQFGAWVPVAALGQAAEPMLKKRIQKVWKTDLFLSTHGSTGYAAATIKSNYLQLEDGAGLRVGIVPEAPGLQPGYVRWKSLHLAVLPDPNGFMGLFNDAYHAVGRAMCKLGKLEPPVYWAKPSAKAQRLQKQLEKYPTVKVVDVEEALNEAAQQDLVGIEQKLLSVEPPDWLHMTERKRVPVLAPRPSFEKLD